MDPKLLKTSIQPGISLQEDNLDSSLLDVESISDSDINTPNLESKFQKLLCLETAQPSVRSTHSSKRLEWDSGADVGYRTVFTESRETQLCTIEKMALSSSATRLCFLEDDRSESLLTRIDQLLSRHKLKTNATETNVNIGLPKESIVSSVESINTVVPVPKIKINDSSASENEQTATIKSQSIVALNNDKGSIHSETESTISDFEFLPPENFKRVYGEARKAEKHYAGDTESLVSDRDLRTKELKLRSKNVKMEVYHTFRDHLQSLRQYVTQLEKTWELLASSESEREKTASSLSSIHHERQDKVRKKKREKASRTLSSSREPSSIPVEKLNLRDLVSSSNTSVRSSDFSERTSKSNKSCFSHCPAKSTKSSKKSESRTSQTITQREPIAFFVDASTNKVFDEKKELTLQEALREKRPDFLSHAEKRQELLRQAVEWRLSKKENVKSRQLCKKPPHLFTYAQLRSQTEALYSRLPEAQNVKKRKHDEVNKQIVAKDNRTAASLYQKKLQQRVLKGQVAFPHTTCLLNGS